MKKLLSLLFSLGVMSFMMTSSVQAQEVECDCQQYIDAYAEASLEHQEMLDFILELTAEETLEYQDQLNLLAEAVVEAEANLDDCGERVENNADQCAQTPLTAEEQEYLLENPGRVLFTGLYSVEDLRAALLQDLLIHQSELETDTELSYQENHAAVHAYLITEHNLATAIELDLQGIIDALEDAIKEYLRGLGITEFDPDPAAGPEEDPCPDCTEIQVALDAKNTAKTALEAELSTKQQQEQDLLDEQAQFEQDLKDAINAVDDCETVNDYSQVQFSGGSEAAGIMMGVHWHCVGNQAVEDFLDAIKQFRQNHRSESEIQNDLNMVQADILRLTLDLVIIDLEIAQLEADLQACLAVRAALNCDDEPAGGEEGEEGEEVTETPGGTTGTGGGRRRAIPEEPYGPTELTLPTAEVNLEATLGTELLLTQSENNAAVDVFADLVINNYALRTMLPFTDLDGLSTEARAAIEVLGRLRILMGQGVSDPDDDSNLRASAAQEPLKRAELAQIFYRLGNILTGYEVEISGTQIFTDVPPTEWYGPAYEWMFVNGFFIQSRPGDTLNNAEAVTAFRRLVGLEPIVPTNAEVWYDQEFNAVAEFMPAGYSANPWDPATREFIAILVYKVLIEGGLVVE